MIELKDVSKHYGKHQAVAHATATIQKEKITSLIGPNGAGKSTLLSMMSRLMPLDGGEVSLEGRPVGEWNSNELARKLSILKQTNQINLRLTVRDLVSFGRFPYSQGHLLPEDMQYVDHALETMKLTHMEGKYLDQLSGGERQRAFIAMVIAQNTDYILLDEPLNNLDMKHSVQIMKVIRRLTDEFGKTVVLVLHDINFAASYSDEIIAMKDGRIVSSGRTADMIDPSVLTQVYDMDIQIEEIRCQKICLYYGL